MRRYLKWRKNDVTSSIIYYSKVQINFSPKQGSFQTNEGQIGNQWCKIYSSERIHCEYIYNNLFQGGMVPLNLNPIRGGEGLRSPTLRSFLSHRKTAEASELELSDFVDTLIAHILAKRRVRSGHHNRTLKSCQSQTFIRSVLNFQRFVSAIVPKTFKYQIFDIDDLNSGHFDYLTIIS